MPPACMRGDEEVAFVAMPRGFGTRMCWDHMGQRYGWPGARGGEGTRACTVSARVFGGACAVWGICKQHPALGTLSLSRTLQWCDACLQMYGTCRALHSA